MDVLFPPKVEIAVAKLRNRVLVYSVEGDFLMLFDIDGRGTEIYPTVFALWRVPALLPSFLLKGGEVSLFMLGGADLMFPGISVPAEGLPSFKVGEVWSVKVPRNPAPVAVGLTTLSSTEAMKAGLRGKDLRITHYYRDSLRESVDGHFVPNAGFLEDIVIEDLAASLVAQDSDSAEGLDRHSPHDEQDGKTTDEVEKLAVANDAMDHLPSSSTEASKSQVEQLNVEVGNLKVSDNVGDESAAEEEQHTLSAEEVDSLLDNCLLQALHTTVKDKDLSMPGSTLW
ncbi:unnamed protein product [Linum tenue]|uniref:Eukaryotic translation initiation factor 2D n=1 Tax=Linum tenue TaxID=586396 RepID=A0AAV0NL35_9ROSI|nr:unnamed protein product [Linum tenue]CAI0459125.1 unnamed protein product [Linum tenue]